MDRMTQRTRTAWSVLAAAAFDVALLVLFVLLGRIPHKPAGVPADDILNDYLVWLVEPGPGGGGGGGGNQTPLPPKPAELLGKEKITVPAVKPAPVEAPQPPKMDPEPVQLTIPAQTLAAAMQDLPGVIAPPGSLNVSQGPGRGGGGGTGDGGGIGPGDGVGLGPGSGGNTGGGVY